MPKRYQIHRKAIQEFRHWATEQNPTGLDAGGDFHVHLVRADEAEGQAGKVHSGWPGGRRAPRKRLPSDGVKVVGPSGLEPLTSTVSRWA